MCNTNCCCNIISLYGLKSALFVLTGINLCLSAISIFIRAAKTERYDDALMYLEGRNNGTFTNFTFDGCRKDGYIFKDEMFCMINGKLLKEPSEHVSYQSLFKNWGKIELILNISRTVITLLFLAFLYYAIKRKGANIEKMDKEEREDYDKDLTLLIVCLSILIFISGLWILIRVFAITANMEIGLYDNTDQNQFEERIAINYIIDITEIVLLSIEICFVLRIKKYSPPPTRNVIIRQPPPPPPVVVAVNKEVVMKEYIIAGQPTSNQKLHPLDNFNQ